MGILTLIARPEYGALQEYVAHKKQLSPRNQGGIFVWGRIAFKRSMLIPQVMSAGFKCSNVLFRIWNWSRLASKVRKGLELEPFWTRGEPKSDLPDVRFEMFSR